MASTEEAPFCVSREELRRSVDAKEPVTDNLVAGIQSQIIVTLVEAPQSAIFFIYVYEFNQNFHKILRSHQSRQGFYMAQLKESLQATPVVVASEGVPKDMPKDVPKDVPEDVWRSGGHMGTGSEDGCACSRVAGAHGVDEAQIEAVG